jgi:hypothetical protein
MRSIALESIETQLTNLSHDECLWLIEKLAKQIRRQPPPADFEADLIAMANDPLLQKELRAIEAEFAVTEQDGLEGL